MLIKNQTKNPKLIIFSPSYNFPQVCFPQVFLALSFSIVFIYNLKSVLNIQSILEQHGHF